MVDETVIMEVIGMLMDGRKFYRDRKATKDVLYIF